MGSEKPFQGTILRILALIIGIIGALGSVGFMLHSGRYNPSVILISLFVIWVASPFVALLLVYGVSERWAETSRKVFYWIIIIIALGSLIMYSGISGIQGPHPAFLFLVLPLISWLVIGVFVYLASRKGQK